MRFYIYLFLFVTSLYFSSCNDFEQTEIAPFKVTKKITGKEIWQNNKKGTSIYIVDTLILLKSSKDSLFYVYGIESNQYLGSIIKKGKGNGAFSAVFFYGQFITDHSGIKIWITDYMTKEMNLVNVTASLKEKRTIVEQHVSIANEIIADATSYFYVKGDKVVGYHNVQDGEQPYDERFFNMNTANSTVAFKKIPALKTKKDLSTNLRNMSYQSIARIKPDGSKIIDVRHYQPKLNIVDTGGNHLASFIFDKNYPEEFTEEVLRARVNLNYFEAVYVSNKYIYLLRTDQLDKDVTRVKKPIEILIVDWKGNPVKKLLIPEYILSFAVDEKSNILYGLDYISQRVFKYHI